VTDPRYRCAACGNLTRFDVTVLRRTKAFYHYTLGGDLEVEDPEVLDEHIEQVHCRWCGGGGQVVEITDEAPVSADDVTPHP
jgi:hypothetical protein